MSGDTVVLLDIERAARRGGRPVMALVDPANPSDPTLDADAADARLAAAFPTGGEPTFAAVYSRWSPLVYSTARRVLIDSHEAADVTQEVFVVVHRRLESFDGTSKPTTSVSTMGNKVSVLCEMGLGA